MDLPASVTKLERGGTTYYIVGTAHVSQRSVDEVKAVIEAVRPEVVCVELCKARYDALTKDSAFRDLDVFVFTLGLTEAWVAKADGAVFPLAPGVVSQSQITAAGRVSLPRWGTRSDRIMVVR